MGLPPPVSVTFLLRRNTVLLSMQFVLLSNTNIVLRVTSYLSYMQKVNIRISVSGIRNRIGIYSDKRICVYAL